MTLSNFILIWLKNFVQIECKPSTEVMYRSVVNSHILPSSLSQMLLEDIKPVHGMEFRAYLMERNLKGRSINKVLIVLKTMLNKAVELQYIPFNPLKSLKLLKLKPRKYELWTQEQIDLFKASETPWKPVIYLALFGGLRLGEIASLTRSDVFMEYRYIVLKDTKNGEDRKVPMCSELLAEMIAIMPTYYTNEILPDDRLFPIDDRTFTQKIFVPLCKRLGLPVIRFHDLRHLFATIYKQRGGDLFCLSKILGHSSVKITEQTYLHVDMNSIQADYDRIFK